MTSQERKALVLISKEEGRFISGKYIDLHPYVSEHSEAIVRLRNQEKSRYYLNQKEPSTQEGQNKWYGEYEQRDNDIYWCIFNKSGVIVGVIRLYNIELDGGQCEEGSFIIDEKYAMSSPYALEAKILAFNFAFDALRIDKVINIIRADNKNMNSIGRRMGFAVTGELERNGALYNRCELTKNAYKKDYLENTLSKWRERE